MVMFQRQLFSVLFPLAYYSPGGKKNIYLNSGLTSTKNYGKTILTKVRSLIFFKRTLLKNVFMCVCGVHRCIQHGSLQTPGEAVGTAGAGAVNRWS